MEPQGFPIGVAERLQWYVYRLIDPRNGETFYVGKGKDDRVFQHVKGALADQGDEDATDLKFQRIKEIDAAGLAVLHVIHRHGMDEDSAFQVEAALIDAYPGLHNVVGGHGSAEFGPRHVNQIIAYYIAQEFEPKEPLILISIGESYDDELQNIYEAVRCCWRLSPTRANGYRLVLAHRRGLVVGAFRPIADWLPATVENFPALKERVEGRFGFAGHTAEPAVADLYLRKRVPDRYRPRGASNPVRFIDL